MSQNEISRYQPFKSKFSPDTEFGLFVVNYSTTIYLSTVKRVLFKTVFKYIKNMTKKSTLSFGNCRKMSYKGIYLQLKLFIF